MGLFGKWSRRDLLKSSGAVAGALTPVAAQAAHAAKLPAHTGTEKDNLFTRIGVRPLINGRGTYTIISGSRSLPEVKQAMFEASHYYVQMDEMENGVGAELARLTGANGASSPTAPNPPSARPPSPALPAPMSRSARSCLTSRPRTR